MACQTRYRSFGVAILKQEVDGSIVGKFQHLSSEARGLMSFRSYK